MSSSGAPEPLPQIVTLQQNAPEKLPYASLQDIQGPVTKFVMTLHATTIEPQTKFKKEGMYIIMSASGSGKDRDGAAITLGRIAGGRYYLQVGPDTYYITKHEVVTRLEDHNTPQDIRIYLDVGTPQDADASHPDDVQNNIMISVGNHALGTHVAENWHGKLRATSFLGAHSEIVVGAPYSAQKAPYATSMPMTIRGGVSTNIDGQTCTYNPNDKDYIVSGTQFTYKGRTWQQFAVASNMKDGSAHDAPHLHLYQPLPSASPHSADSVSARASLMGMGMGGTGGPRHHAHGEPSAEIITINCDGKDKDKDKDKDNNDKDDNGWVGLIVFLVLLFVIVGAISTLMSSKSSSSQSSGSGSPFTRLSGGDGMAARRGAI